MACKKKNRGIAPALAGAVAILGTLKFGGLMAIFIGIVLLLFTLPVVGKIIQVLFFAPAGAFPLWAFFVIGFIILIIIRNNKIQKEDNR